MSDKKIIAVAGATGAEQMKNLAVGKLFFQVAYGFQFFRTQVRSVPDKADKVTRIDHGKVKLRNFVAPASD